MSKTDINSLLEEFEPEDRQLAEQLFNLRQEPSLELRRNVLAIPHQPSRPGRFSNLQLSWAIALLLVMVILFASPAAKATLGQVEKLIGQIRLTVSDILPGSDKPFHRGSKRLTLAEAQTVVPFKIATPGYLAAGLTTNEPEVYLIELDKPIVKILWRDTEGGFIQLTTHHPYEGDTGRMETLVGPDSSETILINGRQAVLVHGGWDNSSQTWSYRDRVKTLIWEVDQIQYKLLYFGDAIPIAELVAMAESVGDD
jgi:hypothetical protein